MGEREDRLRRYLSYVNLKGFAEDFEFSKIIHRTTTRVSSNKSDEVVTREDVDVIEFK